MTVRAYPLQWPVGWKRTQPGAVRSGRFGKAREKVGDNWLPFRPVTMAGAVERVLEELQRMGITREDVVISTNVRLRLDGLPRGDQPAPSDVGAAVYWAEPVGARRVMAIDAYDRVEDNIAAIAATLEAMRSIERHGGAVILERAFTGFTALPAPDAQRGWREVMGFGDDQPVNVDAVRLRYRQLASEAHPDRPGGDPARMARLNVARDQALQECAP